MISTAVISECEKYRYSLQRSWAVSGRSALFVMLNPSTADATVDDPTIRRCIGFARSWGCDSIEVVNLYAYRATNPSDLLALHNWVARGPDNLHHVSRALRIADVVVAAWGAWVDANPSGPRPLNLVDVAEHLGVPLRCLGYTKSGAPRHPLYVKADQPLLPFPRPA